MKVISTKILSILLLAGLACPGISSMANQESLSTKAIYYGGAVLACGALYCANSFVSTLVHEVGHAVPARILSGKPVGVVIGRSYQNMSEADYNTFETTLEKRSHMVVYPVVYNSQGGFTVRSEPKKSYQNILISLAGPCAGMLYNYGLFRYIKQYESPTQAVDLPFMLGSVVASGMLINYLNLIPDEDNSDGHRIITKLQDKPWMRKAYYAFLGMGGLAIGYTMLLSPMLYGSDGKIKDFDSVLLRNIVNGGLFVAHELLLKLSENKTRQEKPDATQDVAKNPQEELSMKGVAWSS